MAKQAKTEVFIWEGLRGRTKVSGEMSGTDITLAKATLRQQGIIPTKIRKKPMAFFNRGQKIKNADIAVFTRQLATLINAGIPVMQSLEILSRGLSNPSLQTLLVNLKTDIESGCSLSDALRKYPDQFNALYCSLVSAGEQSGSLDNMLLKIASYREKTESMKGKIKKALFYPVTVIGVAFLITAGMLIFVIPQFALIFQGFGADLPIATQMVINLSKIFQAYWWIIFGIIGGAIFFVAKARKQSKTFAYAFDKYLLRIPVIGKILTNATIARYARTLATTFAAGLPLVDALQAVAGATGNLVYTNACLRIRDEVSTGQQLNQAMRNAELFPTMVNQMVAIGEESGSLDFMLSKIADFYEEDVDNAVSNLSTLLEPLIMIILGVLVGGLVVAMYMPIFKLGGVISSSST